MVRDRLSCREVLLQCCRDGLCGHLLHLATEQLTPSILSIHVIKVKSGTSTMEAREAVQVAQRHVDTQVRPQPAVLLHCRTSARQGLVDLLPNHLGQVREEYRIVGGHLGMSARQARQELRLQDRRLELTHALGQVTSEPEVWVLIDAAGNEASQALAREQGVGERGTQRWHHLQRRERHLSRRVRPINAKGSSDLVACQVPLRLAGVGIQVADLLEVGEDVGPCGIEAAGDDVPHVCIQVALALLKAEAFEEKLLVICQLDDARSIEGLLEVCCEEEGHQVSKMHGSRWTTPRVQVELFSTLVSIQQLMHGAVGTEESAL
mmetsp:Transcript_5060/g.14796  ORF Transcript_5060/g.14796 Transcript_5060/m.14796 type:complete len:321 (-) Transcript_5060:412-1374(-)